jgi:hypothetical protein
MRGYWLSTRALVYQQAPMEQIKLPYWIIITLIRLVSSLIGSKSLRFQRNTLPFSLLRPRD